jgi:hypothetical protein
MKALGEAVAGRNCLLRSVSEDGSRCGNTPHDKTYLIRFKPSDLSPHVVIDASAEIHGEHLVFLRSDGSLAVLFFLEVVEKLVGGWR